MSLATALAKQFRRPRGMLGRVAGWIMRTRQSNIKRNQWTVDLLDVNPGHRVLELGPGPGITLGLLLNRSAPGTVTAIDHSRLMLDACRKRHAAAIRAGRLSIIESAFPGIPDSAMFDRIIAVNSLQFDAETAEAFAEIGQHLVPGGLLAVTFQPRGAKASEASADCWAVRVAGLMTDAGLEIVATKKLALDPVPAICVLATRRPSRI